MLLIPAIDLKDGHCVRLQQGDMEDATTFGEDPAAMARALARSRRAAPAPGRPERRLRRQAEERSRHQGHPAARWATRFRCNSAAASATSTPSSATSTTGCSYVIIGTAAVKNPGFLQDACSAFGGHIIVGLDAKDGKVATDGWSKLTGHEVIDLAQEVRRLRRRIASSTPTSAATACCRGINIEATVKLAQALSIPVIASGGLSNMADIESAVRRRGRRHRRRDLRPQHLQRRAGLRGCASACRFARRRRLSGRAAYPHSEDMAAASIEFRGRPAVRLDLPDGSSCTIALHGGHVLSWITANGWLSGSISAPRPASKAELRSAAACRSAGRNSISAARCPSTGLRATMAWQLADSGTVESGDGCTVALLLRDTEATRAIWPHAFTARLTVKLAPWSLHVALDIENTGNGPLSFTAALHTYCAWTTSPQRRCKASQGARRWDAVRDVHENDTAAAAAFRRRVRQRLCRRPPRRLRLVQPTGATRDLPKRQLHARPWSGTRAPSSSASLADMPDDGWRHMLCVEAARIDEPVLLAPRRLRGRAGSSLTVESELHCFYPMLAKRIIPCLDVTGGRVVKGVNFLELRDAGDPVEIAARYNAQGADELTFLDITATSDGRDLILPIIEAVASQVFIPLTVGGGVRTVEDVRRLLNAGADKTSFNSAAIANPQVIEDASGKYGAQCIVVAIDAKRRDGRRRRRPRRRAGTSTATAAARTPASMRWSGPPRWRAAAPARFC